MHLLNLPDELLIEICGHVRAPMSLLSIASTCRRFSHIVHHQNVENITVPLGERLFIEAGKRILPEAQKTMSAKNPLREIFRGVRQFGESSIVAITPEEELHFADILNMRSSPGDHELDRTFCLAELDDDDDSSYDGDLWQKKFKVCLNNASAPYSVADLKNPHTRLFPRVYHLARGLDGQIVIYSPLLFDLPKLYLHKKNGDPYMRNLGEMFDEHAKKKLKCTIAPSREISDLLYASEFINAASYDDTFFEGSLFNLRVSNLPTHPGECFPKFRWLCPVYDCPSIYLILAQHVRNSNPEGLTMGICMDINNPGVNTFLEGNGENHFTCKIGKTELSGLLGMNMFNCGAHAGCMNKINAANSTWMPCGPIEAFIDKPFLTLDGGSAPVCFASLGEVFRSWAERTLGPAEYFVFEMNYKPGESSVCDGTLIAKLNVDTRPSNLKAKNN